jgi:cardiolipin synthase
MLGNFEVNVEIYDEAVARQMEEIFAADAAGAQEVTASEWQRRPLLEKIGETILLPLRPLL